MKKVMMNSPYSHGRYLRTLKKILIKGPYYDWNLVPKAIPLVRPGYERNPERQRTGISFRDFEF
jgi:hypothetical protein